MSTGKLAVRVKKKADVRWKEILPLQQDGFKEHSARDKEKLKKSLVDNGFALPFNVWEDADKKLYCLDGHHRIEDLLELEAEGVVIPDTLPANFIDCVDRQEAAKFLLIYSSQYAKITEAGFQEFISMHQLDLPALTDVIAMPFLDEPIQPVAATPVGSIEPQWFLNVKCADEAECQRLYEEFTNKGFEVKIIT